MFRKKVCLLLILCMLLSCCVSAQEEISFNLSYEPENGEVTVLGSADEGDIVAVIAPVEISAENFSAENPPTLIRQYKKSGEFEIKLGMPKSAGSGRYYVYISANGCESKKSFVHISAEDALSSSSLISMINAADGSAFNALLSENALKLGIDTEDEIYIANKNEIFEIMDNMNFTDLYDFYDKYVLVYVISMITGESDTEKTKLILKNYDKQLGLDYSADFENDKRMSADAKKKLCELLTDAEYAEEAEAKGEIDFKDIFEKLKPVAAISATDNWTKLKEIVTVGFADVFSPILTENNQYSSINDKDAVFEEMMQSELTSLEVFKTQFDNAVTEVYNNENPPKQTGGTGTLGGSSTGGGKTTVSPSYNEEKTQNEPLVSFTDVKDNYWAYNAIGYLVKNGVISGYEDNTFKPAGYITRAEFIKMIMPFATDLSNISEASFTDVSGGEWYCKVVSDAASKGLIKGADGLFKPNEFIKREDAALIIYRLFGLLNRDVTGYRTFADKNDISDYAEDAVFALAGAYVLNGNENNEFLPAQNITRAETAQLIYNAFKK